MTISVFDIFKIGVGPSSSHTVGPMRAARQFLLDLQTVGKLEATRQVIAELYGSLALTGAGHGTDRAVLLGLEGETPDEINPDTIETRLRNIREAGRIRLLGSHEIAFDEPLNLLLHKDQILPRHSNGMRFTALDDDEQILLNEDFYSIGGGFIVRGHEEQAMANAAGAPYPFESSQQLLELCGQHQLSIHELMFENEKAWRSEQEIRTGLLNIWSAMKTCVARGMREEGELPGGLKVRRRAAKLHRQLTQESKGMLLDAMDWVNLWALAVNEENAAGGRVVTAPTNGAAGIIPAVGHYYERFVEGADEAGILRYLLTAGAIAILYKKNASISGAEMGCQGEVGVACSMAAGGLVAAMQGSTGQVENAAEIGMEHNL
ncbi:MAG: L-serine ammonia-lyase, partial [Gammaproteobacteria bacterium]